MACVTRNSIRTPPNAASGAAGLKGIVEIIVDADTRQVGVESRRQKLHLTRKLFPLALCSMQESFHERGEAL
jgi:hypothetical protein